MTCSLENDEMKTTAPLKADNTEMFLSMTPLASWPDDSPGNKTLRKRCYPTFFYGRAMALSRSGLSIWQVAAVVIMSNRESY